MEKLKVYVALISYYGKLKVNEVLALDKEDAYEQELTNSPDGMIILTANEACQIGRKLTSIGAAYK